MPSYTISGLPAAPFTHLFGLDDAALAERGARRYVVDAEFGFPDRIEMRDLAVGETAILVNYTHQPAATPFRASHAIFVREGATESYAAHDTVPDLMRRRTLSLRAFDAAGMMTDAALASGDDIDGEIRRLLAAPDVAYLHAHYATRGCFAARIDRA